MQWCCKCARNMPNIPLIRQIRVEYAGICTIYWHKLEVNFTSILSVLENTLIIIRKTLQYFSHRSFAVSKLNLRHMAYLSSFLAPICTESLVQYHFKSKQQKLPFDPILKHSWYINLLAYKHTTNSTNCDVTPKKILQSLT